jgi:asparagine synthase (glutamine-hydrolysing)
MEDTLPRDIVYRAKQGFAVPLARWFRRDLRELARDTIFGTDDGILHGGYLRQLWREHQRGARDGSAQLWAVLMFRKWQAGAARLVP